MGCSLFWGIDPGVRGAVSCICRDAGSLSVRILPFARLEARQIASTLESWCQSCRPEHVVIEKVGGYAGGPGQPGARAFVFGRSAGLLEGILLGLGIDHYDFVRPQTWQKWFGVMPRFQHEKKTSFKRRIFECARLLIQRRAIDCQSRLTIESADSVMLGLYALDSAGERLSRNGRQ